MSLLRRLVVNIPMPARTRLAWRRAFLDSAYSKDIAAARSSKNRVEIDSLERDPRFEGELLDEEEDDLITRNLLADARRLRVSIPRRYNNDNTESDFWYQGHYSGQWNLTRLGESAVREGIRCERRVRHELRSQWVVWLSALTGLIGTLTGLIALLVQQAP